MVFQGQGIFAENSSQIRDDGICILPIRPNDPMDSPEERPLDALAAYVRKVMTDHNLSVYAVEKQARKRGGTLGKSTVDAVLQGRLSNPGIFTLRGLAWGLSRPVEEVIAVTVGTAVGDTAGFKKSDLANIYDQYSLMGKSDQRFFDRMFEMLDREARRILGRD